MLDTRLMATIYGAPKEKLDDAAIAEDIGVASNVEGIVIAGNTGDTGDTIGAVHVEASCQS